MINCNNIPLKDKGCHFIAGFVITLVVGLIAGVGYGLFIGALAGILKETYDEYSYGGADFFDLFATLFGTFIAGATVLLITYMG